MMKEKSIIFNTREVRAILDKQKNQFRVELNTPEAPACIYDHFKVTPTVQILKAEQGLFAGFTWEYQNKNLPKWEDRKLQDYVCSKEKCPYVIGQRLWVKETFSGSGKSESDPIHYKADFSIDDPPRWMPSTRMPRNFSRIMIEITNVRVERFCSISEIDALFEGIGYEDDRHYNNAEHAQIGGVSVAGGNPASSSFFSHWAKEKKDYNIYERNPFVWVVEFKRVEDVQLQEL